MIETFLIEALKAVVWMFVGPVGGLLLAGHRHDPLGEIADAPCSDYDANKR